MNWFSNLLRKPAVKPSLPPPTRKPARQSVVPPIDTETLRSDLAKAADDEERGRVATDLGRALAGMRLEPRKSDPPEVWVAAISHNPDKALALAWLAGLAGDVSLEAVATHGRFAEVRLAAAQTIRDPAVLERVAQHSRDKDKRVYRHCSESLRKRRQADESARRGEAIAAELRVLLNQAPLPVTHLLDLKKELAGLETAAGPMAACHDLMDRALARLQQEAEARRELQAGQNAAAALSAECREAAWPWTAQLDGWRARLDELIRTRDGLPAWLAGQAGARGLAQSVGDIESSLTALVGESERFQACEQFLDALAGGMPPDAEAVAGWEVLDKPEHPSARIPLETRWHILLDLAPPVSAVEPEAAPAVAPKSPPRIDQDALRGQLEAMEQALEHGHLADADAALKQIKALVAGKGLRGALETRMQHAQARLEQLHGWARWGTVQAREQLIAAAEALLGDGREPDDLASAIHTLREEWKRLNSHGPAGKGQWERFDTTLEKAYQPVAARRAEQAARNAEAAAVKEALCGEWEAELAAIVWEHADYKVVEARRLAMLKQWRAAPKAGFGQERALRKRFDALLGSIDDRLEAARRGEFERREQLIAAAEALRDDADLGRAMTEAKALQGRWRQEATGPRLGRGDEQALWQRFRAACDTVFARRDAQHAEQSALREEMEKTRLGLLDAFAAIAAGNDANGIERALDRFRTDWSATEKAPAKREPGKRAKGEAEDGLAARWRGLQLQAQQRIDALRQEAYRARFEHMAHKAALAERVEAAAVAGEASDDVIAGARREWGELPRLPGRLEVLLAERFAAATGAAREALAAGLKTREALLIDLEIALGLPTPEGYAEVRRQRQLERLQMRFGNDSSGQEEAETLLAQWYATAATPDPACERRIGAVAGKLATRAAPDNRG